MIGIVIAGHGEFAKGVASVVELVAGKQEKLELVDFLQGDSNDALRENIRVAIDRLDTKETIIFTDIPGGTPFKESAALSVEQDGIEVISGTNIPMLMEILFDRSEGTLKSTKEKALEIGKNQVVSFELEEDEDDDDFGDGI